MCHVCMGFSAFHYSAAFHTQNWVSQQTITCSNSTIETIEKMFKIDNKDTEITSLYNHWKY